MTKADREIIQKFIDYMERSDVEFKHLEQVNPSYAVSHKLTENPLYLDLKKITERTVWEDVPQPVWRDNG
jgi:NADPH-dependent glutamate synthase beta subunit-like oxidoreductase